MAKITITNTTPNPILLEELYVTIPGDGELTVDRFINDLAEMPRFMAAVANGTITIRAMAVEQWELAYSDLVAIAQGEHTWPFATNEAIQFAGGFYDFDAADNDFSPALAFGTVGVGVGAHFAIVVGAVTVDQVTITVSGTSVTDSGVQVGSDSEDIVVPAGTAVDSYFETTKKWNGRITSETTAGTAVTCNYGWVKYFDLGNQDFEVRGLEVLWESDSTDSGSDIQLLIHSSVGWTFNAGAVPTFPSPGISMVGDYAGNSTLRVGQGAWKRTDLSLKVTGSSLGGILWCVTSGNLGIGTLSFRTMSLSATLRKLPPGNIP